jgi:hypothetical protein
VARNPSVWKPHVSGVFSATRRLRAVEKEGADHTPAAPRCSRRIDWKADSTVSNQVFEEGRQCWCCEIRGDVWTAAAAGKHGISAGSDQVAGVMARHLIRERLSY